MFANGEIVTLVRVTGGGVDQYGDPIPQTTTEVPLRAAVEPRTSEDITTGGRGGLIVGLRLHVPAGTEVAATDRFRVRGQVYEVEGDVAGWQSPLTGRSGPTVVNVRRAQG